MLLSLVGPPALGRVTTDRGEARRGSTKVTHQPQYCFTSLNTQRGKKYEFLLKAHRLPSFDTTPVCDKRVIAMKNTDAGPLFLWLEK